MRQQELYEAEESLHYKGLEEAVHRELEARAARDAQTWDDWALFDEMHHGGSRGRKRPCLAITVDADGASGSAGPPRRWMIPFNPGVGRVLTVGFDYMDETNEATSDASTVRPASPERKGLHKAEDSEGVESSRGRQRSQGPTNHGEFPLDFGDFQALYEVWTQGGMCDEVIRERYGPATLDMLQAQHIVVTEGTQVLASRTEAAGSASHGMDGIPEAEAAEGITLAEAPGSGAGSNETFLDTLLSTCRTWRTSQDGSYEDVDQ